MKIGDYITFETMRELGEKNYNKFRSYLRETHRYVVSDRWGSYDVCETDGRYNLVFIDNATDLVAGVAPSKFSPEVTEYTVNMILELIGVNPKYTVKDKTLSEISEMIRVMREEIKEREEAIEDILHQIGKITGDK